MKVFFSFLTAGVLTLLPSASAQKTAPTPGSSDPAATASAADLAEWRKATAAVIPLKKGCYTVDFPSKAWRKMDCGPAPADPPRTLQGPSTPKAPKGIEPNATPLQGDWTIAPTNPISSVTGSLITLNNVTSVGSVNANNGVLSSGLFSLQINSNQSLAVPSSAGCLNTGCNGWIQFVYNSNRQLYIQYWFINYLSNTSQSCPSSFTFNDKGGKNSSGLDCGNNAAFATLAAPAPSDFTTMQGVTLVGQALSNGTVAATLNAGGKSFVVTGTDLVGAAGSSWKQAEFNVFGWGTNSSGQFLQAQFNAGAQLTIGLVSNNDSSGVDPGCVNGSATAENTNLFLGPCNLTSAPGIWFNESPTTPQLTGLNPAQGPAAGGTAIQVLGGPFNQQFQIEFGTQPVSPINTLSNDVSVLSPAGSVGIPVPVSAAYVFPNGSPGPFSTPVQYSYFAAPGCSFSQFCPFFQNQPPSYTATCSTPSDFYTTSDIHTPADFNLIQENSTTNTGSTTEEAVSLAACEPGSKTGCSFFSISTANRCLNPHPKPPPPCTRCGTGRQCCANPDGGKVSICVPSTQPCPVLQ